METDERRSDRRKVVLMATINGSIGKVRVCNLSAHGALICGDDLPSIDELVDFRCNGRSIQSWVAWSDGKYVGIQFTEKVNLSELTQKNRAHAANPIPDSRIITHRRPGFRGNQLTAEERAVIAAWQTPYRSFRHE